MHISSIIKSTLFSRYKTVSYATRGKQQYDFFHFREIISTFKLHINRIRNFFLFIASYTKDNFLKLSILLSISVDFFFQLMSITPLYEHITICLSFLLSDGHWECFLFWHVMNKAFVNICVHVFVQVYFHFSQEVPWREMSWLYVSCLPFEETAS